MFFLIIAINVVLVLFALGIASGIVPVKMFRGAVTALHKTVGITLPTADNERTVAIFWIGSMIVIGDGILFLLVKLSGAVLKA